MLMTFKNTRIQNSSLLSMVETKIMQCQKAFNRYSTIKTFISLGNQKTQFRLETRSRSRFCDLYMLAVDSGVCVPFKRGNELT